MIKKAIKRAVVDQAWWAVQRAVQQAVQMVRARQNRLALAGAGAIAACTSEKARVTVLDEEHCSRYPGRLPRLLLSSPPPSRLVQEAGLFPHVLLLPLPSIL
jgi:hypothetical protein